MIKNIYIAILTVLAVLCSCNNIGENDRYILIDSKEIVEPEPEDSVSFKRKTLIEEYTGQMCVNCPLGHNELTKIHEYYGSQVVLVGIHAGSLAVEEELGGLMTKDGDVYAKQYGVQAYPSIVIDRKSGAIQDLNQWNGMTERYVTEYDAMAAISMEVVQTVSPNSAVNIAIHSDITANKGVKADLKYQVFVVENGIVTFQIMPNNDYNMEYIHNHVYRAAVNGTDGVSVSISDAKPTAYDCSITANEAWNVNNLVIVGVLSDKNGVVQAQQIELKDKK